jgi:hypothetical protein
MAEDVPPGTQRSGFKEMLNRDPVIPKKSKQQ